MEKNIWASSPNDPLSHCNIFFHHLDNRWEQSPKNTFFDPKSKIFTSPQPSRAWKLANLASFSVITPSLGRIGQKIIWGCSWKVPLPHCNIFSTTSTIATSNSQKTCFLTYYTPITHQPPGGGHGLGFGPIWPVFWP